MLRIKEAVYMYAQFEAAGLIVGTDEWKKLQEQKYLQMIEEDGRDGMQGEDNDNRT